MFQPIILIIYLFINKYIRKIIILKKRKKNFRNRKNRKTKPQNRAVVDYHFLKTAIAGADQFLPKPAPTHTMLTPTHIGGEYNQKWIYIYDHAKRNKLG